ncbi:MAG TPA: Zn-dependent hydrolase [Clostridia bacterium]|nr:Zn-dependent hydrolase [Clostridia bacterium]
MPNHTITVNRQRLSDNLSALAQIGKSPSGGLDRHFGSSADLEARRFLKALWQKAFGAEVITDAAANLWVKAGGLEALPPIAIGSHHDTVKNGGMYDGAMGVLLATEAFERINEAGIRLRHPLLLAAFTGEEPNPFGFSTIGSKLLSGKLTHEKLKGGYDAEDGVTIEEALKNAGGDFAAVDSVRMNPGELAAFIECHIEQGVILEGRGAPIGVVERIVGIYREELLVKGEANHSGTTVMARRRDALTAAAQVVLAIEDAARSFESDTLVATVGRMEVLPNSANIIPGEVALTFEVRTPDENCKKKALEKLGKAFTMIIEERGVTIERRTALDQPTAVMDARVVSALERASQGICKTLPGMVSMAGHDAAHMAKVTRSGMLFVRTPGGKSHCPEETANLDDIEKAGNALLSAIILLDKELD